MSAIPLHTHTYIGFRKSCWAGISVFLVVMHVCWLKKVVLGWNLCFLSGHACVLAQESHAGLESLFSKWSCMCVGLRKSCWTGISVCLLVMHVCWLKKVVLDWNLCLLAGHACVLA